MPGFMFKSVSADTVTAQLQEALAHNKRYNVFVLETADHPDASTEIFAIPQTLEERESLLHAAFAKADATNDPEFDGLTDNEIMEKVINEIKDA